MDTEQNNRTTHLSGFERYLRVLKGLQAESANRYCSHVDEFMAWRAGNAQTTSIASIQPQELQQEVEQYLYWCFMKGNANTTRLTKLTALQNYFRYLVYSGAIAADPTENIPKPSAESAALIPFTRAEVHNLFGAIDPSTGKRPARYRLHYSRSVRRIPCQRDIQVQH